MRINSKDSQAINEGNASLRITPADKVSKTKDIRRFFGPGVRRERTEVLDLLAMPSSGTRPRVGIIVAKHGQKNVQRNLVKRRLKEIARTNLLPSLRKENRRLDILIRAKKQAYRSDFSWLESEAKEALKAICSST